VKSLLAIPVLAMILALAQSASGVASVASDASDASTATSAVAPSPTGSAGEAAPGRASEPPPGGARRIVSLVPSVTETVFALGAGDRLVGISTFCDHPPEATKLPRIGTYNAPSIEAIVALEPDVVIGVPTPGNQASVEQLGSLGLEVVMVGEHTLADTWEAIRTVGRWTDTAPAAERLVAKLQGELDDVRRRAAERPTRRVLFVVGHDPLVVAGGGLFIDELIEVAGGRNVGKASGLPWPRLSLETVVAAAPEVIVDGAMGSEANAALEAYWEAYRSVPAVRDGRVRPVHSWILLRPGPRIAAAARELFSLVHEDAEPRP